MKSWKKPTDEIVDNALDSLKKMTARKYFFSRLENPLWLKPLSERECFKYPPKSQRFNDGTVEFPYWPEIRYLTNICREVPDEVVDLVMEFPETDNPIVYDGILDIALQIPGKQSVKLKDKILEYVDMEHQLQTHKYGDLLAHWTRENQTSAVLELLEILVVFAPDPKAAEKRKLRKEDPMRSWTLLPPLPRFGFSYYQRILEEVRVLAESKPYEVACFLIKATSDMIRLRTHQDDMDKVEDHSEIWCPRLSKTDTGNTRPERILVDTLTFVCEKVFGESPHVVENLDKILRKQRWKIFKRLRHHLYAQSPNKETKPWIRELILAHEDYPLSEYRYEFQQMIRCACEHFGETLLTKAERARIFDAILEGPSKENYRHWLVGWIGEEFTEEKFRKRQQRFYRMQFTPFISVLFGKYEVCFKKLETGINTPISDEDYPPFKSRVRSVAVSNRSPRSSEDLAEFTDEELLTFINEWEDEDKFYRDDELEEININIEALVGVFHTVFRESIIPDASRLRFWIENRERIERPIYVRTMINAMQTDIRAKNFDKLSEWLTFSEWVLTHPDTEYEGDYEGSDESRKDPSWSRSRRAVCDFISACLEEDVDVPITARGQLTTLLDMLCTQFDWHLDSHSPKILRRANPLTDAINNTRSLALQELVTFGFWLRGHDSENEVSKVTAILEKRFSQETEYPLTLPEYAVLAANYPRMFSLSEEWAIKHKSDFFPQCKLLAWLAAFGCFITYSQPSKFTFEILKDDFNFALQKLDDFKNHEVSGSTRIDVLGQHLFTYYLWEMYPLTGEESLLARFYQRTDEKREHWAKLFNDIGRRLRNSGKDIEPNIKEKIITFFEWRLEQKEQAELKHFTMWLQAECLDAEWRLNAYSKVLDVCKIIDWDLYLKTLCEMLPNHTPKVVECFLKLTEKSKGDNIYYILTEEAKAVLKAGLESRDKNARRNAKLAQENLLRADRFDLLNLDD